MESNKEGKGWMSVPAFGEWDMKNGVPDYSMDFSKIREKRKQSKMELTNRASLGNEDDLVNRNGGGDDRRRNHVDHRSSADVADHRRPLHRDHSPASFGSRQKNAFRHWGMGWHLADHCFCLSCTTTMC